MIQTNSFLAGSVVLGQETLINPSPVNGEPDSQITLLSPEQLKSVFTQAKQKVHAGKKRNFTELTNLARYLKANQEKFTSQIVMDSGFIWKDAQDLVNSSIEFCENYHLHLKEILMDDISSSFSFRRGARQKIKLTSSPFGLIAATTPRNTPLITELTIIVHALWSGNVLVLRPSPGVAGTVSLLIDGLKASFLPETLARLNIVFSKAKDFIDTSLNYANLLHYVGSTKYLEGTLIAGIKKGVKVLVDGDGCSLVLVDSTVNIKEAAKNCYEGLIRCNGQICISVRVVVVEQTVYKEFLFHFINFIKTTNIHPPSKNSPSDMGPLFSSTQVNDILAVAKKYKLLSGRLDPLSYGPNYISPIVVGLKPTDRNFLRENLFGPIVGISYFKKDGWKRWLVENPINLTDALFSKNQNMIREFLSASKSPRKVVNADPTIESVFEPWGAFLPSGWNDVNHWYYKYRNFYQLISNLTPSIPHL